MSGDLFRDPLTFLDLPRSTVFADADVAIWCKMPIRIHWIRSLSSMPATSTSRQTILIWPSPGSGSEHSYC